jgi:hypothetical protein
MSQPPLTPHEKLYYGSLPVHFAAVPGRVVPFAAEHWAVDPSSGPAVVAKGRPLDLGDGLPGLVVPAVPSLDYRCIREGGEPGMESAPASFPAQLAAPLLKVPQGSPGVLLQGVASGTRSALVKLGGAWYRLKGCGNNDAGFVAKTEAASSTTPAWRQVRGSAFVKESLTELVMGARMAAALAPHDSLCANGPLGHALYTDAAQLPFGAAAPTACILETTTGDRRLGTHVLAGLEYLLPQLLSAAADEGSVAAFEAAFPAARPREPATVTCAGGCGWGLAQQQYEACNFCGSCQRKGVSTRAPSGGVLTPGALVPTAAFVEASVLATAEAFEAAMRGAAPSAAASLFGWPGVPRDESTLAGLHAPHAASASAALAALERASLPALASLAATPHPQQFVRASTGDSGSCAQQAMDSEYRAAWEAGVGELAGALAALPPGASALAYLFSRLGYDAGCIVRGLHAAGLSWGTYQDGMCNRAMAVWHCNAHSNNLVVVAEGSVPAGAPGSTRLVSMLDIDVSEGEGGYFARTAIQWPTRLSRSRSHALTLTPTLCADGL